MHGANGTGVQRAAEARQISGGTCGEIGISRTVGR